MAKGKHSTALFEVIHSAKEPGRVAQRLNTPKWWFKSRHRSGKPTTEPSPSRMPVSEPEPVVETRRIEPRRPEKKRVETESRSSRVHVGFDRARKEFALRFRYTTALVSGFALCGAVGVAYVVGRHVSHGPQSAAGAEQTSVAQLMQQPANPGVTNVTRSRPVVASVPQKVESPKRTPVLSNANAAPMRTSATSLVPASAVTDLPRAVRLNYVVIATYPVEEQTKAEAARVFFTKAGIPCSLESCGWAPRMISLVGTAGFAHTHDRDFDAYKKNVVDIAKTMKTSQFDRPSPGVYSWKGEPSDKTFNSNQ